MRVIVTGASGFIGRHVLPLLIEKEWEVYAVTRYESTHRGDGIRWIVGDLFNLKCDPVLQKRLESIRATHLLHLAWYAEHGKFWGAEDNFHWVEASMALLRVFHRGGGRKAVIAGTCAEYDWSYGYCREGQTPCEPTSVYSCCKHSLHILSQSWCDSNAVDLCWGRVFFPYGLGEAIERLIPYFVRRLLEEQETLCSNGSLYRDFIHVDDAANAFVTLLEHVEINGTFNICSGEPVKIRDVVYMIGRIVGRVDLIQCNDKGFSGNKSDSPVLVGDNARIRSLGWSPRILLGEGLSNYIEALKREVSHG